jgi:hypothetical protein
VEDRTKDRHHENPCGGTAAADRLGHLRADFGFRREGEQRATGVLSDCRR